MAKHTPGPWRICGEYSSLKDEIGAEGRAVATVWTRKPADGTHERMPIPWDEGLANARLIAAAPDLLEAAIELKDACNRPSAARTRAEAWRRLDHAIAKATGGES